MAKQYEIRFDKTRQKKGLKAWGVFEVVDAGFSRGLSQHQTEGEAEAALAALQSQEG